MIKGQNLKALLPVWFWEQFIVPLRSAMASSFIFHGDINGLFANPEVNSQPAKPYLNLMSFLQIIFSEQQLVIFYDLAGGLTFLTPEMEQKFRDILAIDKPMEKESEMSSLFKSVNKPIKQSKRLLPRESPICLRLLDLLLKKTDRVAVIIKSAHFLVPANNQNNLSIEEMQAVEHLRDWSRSEIVSKNNNVVLLLTDSASKISPELRLNSGLKTVFIPKPDARARKDFIISITEDNEVYNSLKRQVRKLEKNLKRAKVEETTVRLGKELDSCRKMLAQFSVFNLPRKFSVDEFVVATQGMNLVQILDIFRTSQAQSKPLSLDFVKAKKTEILNTEYGDVMEVVEPQRGLEDIGGLEHIKSYFRQVLEAIRKGDSRLVPMGVTLMGPPGTGKTAMVEALAKGAGFAFVKTKSIRSMYVGESETRMEKLIQGLRNLAPVIVLNDEADLNEGSRDAPKGDSGVSERLMKMWMEMLSDPRIRGKIIVINNTNRPDRLDPALKRSGRSDERILVPLPSAVEKEMILKVLLKRHKISTSLTNFSELVQTMDDISGADLEKIVLNAWRFTQTNGKTELDADNLKLAIDDFISSASQEDIDRMTLFGLLESSARRLLPPNAQEILDKIQKRGLLSDFDDIYKQIKDRKIIKVSA